MQEGVVDLVVALVQRGLDLVAAYGPIGTEIGILSLGIKNIEVAAEYFGGKNQRLYIIIDGLDHVWRDTKKVDQLNFLFTKLLPLPQHVTLIVGTQREATQQLPAKLLSAAQTKDWIEIPAMDQIAVHNWIRQQDYSQRLSILGDPKGPYRQEQVDKISM